MKIYFMKEEALYYFKTNVEIFKHEYLNKDNNWIIEKYKSFKGESPFSEFKLEVPDFTLETNQEKPEYNNVKKLYDALKDLSNIQATDERLWAGLAHYNFWNYMLYRGKFTNDINKNKILSDFFFQSSKRRNLITHSLSRLWWIGRLTYDKKRQNPYEALEYLKTDFRTKVLSLFSSNFTSNGYFFGKITGNSIEGFKCCISVIFCSLRKIPPNKKNSQKKEKFDKKSLKTSV